MNNLTNILISIRELNCLELNSLVKLIESDFNISEHLTSNKENLISSTSDIISEEKKEYEVIVENISSDKKISILKFIKNSLNLGLKESKEFIDNLPKLFKKFSSKEEANQIKHELEEAGALVVLK